MINIFLAILCFVLVFGFICFCVIAAYIIKQNKQAEKNYQSMKNRYGKRNNL